MGNYSSATVEDVVIKVSADEIELPCPQIGMSVAPLPSGSYLPILHLLFNEEVGEVTQAELQSTRQKVMLYETAMPLPQLAPGERHDFIIKHDIKEISSYTLICSTSYTDNGETAYQPQYFKFVAQNPLSVRTKIRSLTKQTFLEACVENMTSKPLVLAYVRLDAAPNIAVVPASSTWSEGSPSDDPQSSLPEQYPDSLQVPFSILEHCSHECSPYRCLRALLWA